MEWEVGNRESSASIREYQTIGDFICFALAGSFGLIAIRAVVFTINSTTFTVGGVAQTMDVAPYIKDGRTFLPVRYVAQACGVAAKNILFSEGKVTLIKGDKVVQLTLGSKVMVINGVAINTVWTWPPNSPATAPCCRLSWIAQALGAKVSYDEATQTVTMEI